MDILQNIFSGITQFNYFISEYTILNLTTLSGIEFLLSFYGFIIFCKNILRIKFELIPIFIISLIVCVLNFAGLYGELKQAAYLIYFLGFAALIIVPIISIIRKKFFQNIIDIFTNASFITLIFFSAILIYVLSDMFFSHYDNFSHWAHVVKELLFLDGMPNAESAEIMDFTNYPLGASLFIYYGCRFVDVSDGAMLIFQAIFIVSSMLPLFVFDKKFKITKIPVVILIYVILLIEPKIFNLLVDVLLACLGFASLMIILYYRKNISTAFFTALPTVVALVLVKNSGIFFAVIDVAVLFYFAIKSNYKIKIIYSLLLGIIIGATLWAWNIHCDTVFPEIIGKHSMTSGNFEKEMAQKTVGDVKAIALLMKEKLFDTKDIFIRTLIALNIIALCGRWWHKFIEEDDQKITKIILLLDLTFFIYFIGIFGMYVFSMPLAEALYLAGYERYIMTIVVYLVLVFSAYWIYIASVNTSNEKKANRYGWIMLYCFVLVTSFRLGNGNYNILKLKKVYEETNSMNAVMVENYEHPDSSYVMYVPETYRYQYEIAYFNFLMKYKLRTPSVYPFLFEDFDNPNDESVIKLIRDYDYFIIYDVDEYITGFAREYFDKKDNIATIYRIDDFVELQ